MAEIRAFICDAPKANAFAACLQDGFQTIPAVAKHPSLPKSSFFTAFANELDWRSGLTLWRLACTSA